MGAFAIRIEDTKRKVQLVDGVENCLSAELLLPPIIHSLYESWRREPVTKGSDLISTMDVEYLGLRYTFIDHYWD